MKLLIATLLVTVSAHAFDLKDEAEKYKLRYGVKDVYSKAVDNRGAGDSRLYGVRNFRVVLHGVYYRGGANNVYLKPVARKNSNPLPDVALTNLCEEGFSEALYYYPTNFRGGGGNCRDFEGRDRKLSYAQISALTFTHDKTLIAKIFARIKGQVSGPIYGHCWNGWHASGYVAAIALRQFCSYDADRAVAYWVRNTDGDSNYSKIKTKIRAFKPFAEFAISPAEAAEICP